MTDTALDTFQAVRPRLFGIAYRRLGSASEADDLVQDAWLRWQGTDRSAVREPAAFLATTGREHVARFLLGVLEKFAADVENVPVELNGDIAFVGLRDGVPMAAWTVEIGPAGITRFLNVMNPAKLSRIVVPSGPS